MTTSVLERTVEVQPEVEPKVRPVTVDGWLDALRSGDYQQCRGELRKGDTFCALGVLGDLEARAGGGVWGVGSFGPFDSGWALVTEQGAFAQSLPTTLTDRVGIDEEMIDAIVMMNDSGVEFDRIARFIELADRHGMREAALVMWDTLNRAGVSPDTFGVSRW